MVALFKWIAHDGTKGQCDARCYLARYAPCKCICRGTNHGIGLNKAIENTYHRAQQWLDYLRREYDDSKITGTILQVRLELDGDHTILDYRNRKEITLCQ